MLKDVLTRLSAQLYPNGRAFKMIPGGWREKLHKGLAASEARALTDASAILNSILADNNNFSADDATDWERRLGIIGSASSSLTDRKLAINQKLNYPGTNAPRQHWGFIESQLQLAGFNVHVYENNFGGVAKSPAQILGAGGATLHSTSTRHSISTKHGGQYNNKIANYIEESKDASFVIGNNYRSTFYVAGATITTFANIPVARKDEFRQLILQLKPVQTVGFLFVNYI